MFSERTSVQAGKKKGLKQVKNKIPAVNGEIDTRGRKSFGRREKLKDIGEVLAEKKEHGLQLKNTFLKGKREHGFYQIKMARKKK